MKWNGITDHFSADNYVPCFSIIRANFYLESSIKNLIPWWPLLRLENEDTHANGGLVQPYKLVNWVGIWGYKP